MGKGRVVSKNARAGSRKEILVCRCGGSIIIKSVFTQGKIKHFAECSTCNKIARKPKDLM